MSQIGQRSAGGIVKVTVSTGGTGYTSVPAVAIVGGGGTGATVQAIVDSGRINSVLVKTSGSGFTEAPTLTFSGGGGTGAAATAYVHSGTLRPMAFFKGRYNDMYGVDGMGRGIRWDGDSAAVEPIGLLKPAIGAAITASTTDSQDFVKSIQIVDAGSGYSGTPTVTLSGGTPSVPATASAVISGGKVSRIRITNPGSGYQAAPSVQVTGGQGQGAAFAVSAVGGVRAVNVLNSGSGYTISATTSPSLVFSTAQGLTDANVGVTVDGAGRIDSVFVLAGGTGATTSGVTATVVGGGGTGAVVAVDMAFAVASASVTTAGTGYASPPTVEFVPDSSDSFATKAVASASVSAAGGVDSVTVTSGGRYLLPPTAVAKDTTAKATAALGHRLRGKYRCCMRYIDDTPRASQGPIPSSISEIKEIDVGDAAGGIQWTLTHAGLDDRVVAVELWRTTANQDVLLYRVATIQRDDPEFNGTYSDTLDDDAVIDTERDGYGLMPVTLPSGQINARRFEIPPGEFAIATMFQDRAWYAVDTTGERPNSLMYSEVDEPESVPAANELVVQENTGNPDKIVALVPLGPELLIVQQAHLYKLNYVAQPILDASIVLGAYRGVLNSRCWSVLGGAAFMVDGYGLYAFDGMQEDAVSVPVDNYWRDGIIDFTKADVFHVRSDMSTRTVRFFYCRSSDSLPVRALCYCVATQAWWEEVYPTAVTAACSVYINGRVVELSGVASGGFRKQSGLTDSGSAVSYTLRTGNLPLTPGPVSRSVDLLYTPTQQDSTLSLGLYYNGSTAPRANAISTDRGSGFTTVSGGTAATLNMNAARSPLGTATGHARAYYSGHLDDRSAGGDRHVAIEMSGSQSASQVKLHTLAADGVG